jgi:hypothetical protein
MSAPLICPVGTMSPAGSQSCTTCRAMYLCANAGTTETVYEAT